MTSQAGSPEASASVEQPKDSQTRIQPLPEPSVCLPTSSSMQDGGNESENLPARVIDLEGPQAEVESKGSLATISRTEQEKIDSVAGLMLGFGLYIMGLVCDVFQELPAGIEDDAGPSNFPDTKSSLHVFEWAILLENQTEAITPEEVMELWTTLLTKEERQDFIQKLKYVNIANEKEEICDALRLTELSRVIRAWAGFKRRAKRIAPSMKRAPGLGMGIAWSLLQALRALTGLETRWRRTLHPAEMDGRFVPDLLTRPTTGFDFSAETPFDQLFGAFAERARCRTHNPRSRTFTNVEVLKETKHYIVDLKIILSSLKYKDYWEMDSLSAGSSNGDDRGGQNFTYHGFHLTEKKTGRVVKEGKGYGFLKTL